jgi:hypothetical protein
MDHCITVSQKYMDVCMLFVVFFFVIMNFSHFLDLNFPT